MFENLLNALLHRPVGIAPHYTAPTLTILYAQHWGV